MMGHFNVGDHVRWNSEAGHVNGRIVKVHTRDFDYKGYTHHASKDEPQYEIKSDKSEHIAAHKGSPYRSEHAIVHLIRAEAWAEMMVVAMNFGRRVRASFARGFSRLERGLLKLDSLIRRLRAVEGEPCR